MLESKQEVTSPEQDSIALPEDVQLERLYQAFCNLHTHSEVSAFLADLLTPKELAELTQRFEVARELAQKHPYTQVIKATGASSTTVSRVSKCLQGSAGGYRSALNQLDQADYEH